MKLKNLSLAAIGFWQALGVAIYCALVASFMQYSSQHFVEATGAMGGALMLMLLVFSAGITSSLVFGYATFLFINHKVKEGLRVLAYTFAYLLLMVFLFWLFVSLQVI